MSEAKGACRRATELISQGMDRPLTRRERCGLRVHLMLCRPCRVFRRQVRWLRDLVRSDAGLELPTSFLDRQARLSPEARARMSELLDRSAGEG